MQILILRHTDTQTSSTLLCIMDSERLLVYEMTRAPSNEPFLNTVYTEVKLQKISELFD